MATVKKTRKIQMEARRFSALVELDPKKAALHMKKVFRESGGSFMKAIETLGCSTSAWYGWIRRLKIGKEINAIRDELEKKGVYAPNKGGRPKDPPATV